RVRNLTALINTLHHRLLSTWLREKYREYRRFAPASLDSAPNIPDLAMAPDERLHMERQLAAPRAVLGGGFPHSAYLREILDQWDEGPTTLAARLGSTSTAVATARHKLLRRLRQDPRLA